MGSPIGTGGQTAGVILGHLGAKKSERRAKRFQNQLLSILNRQTELQEQIQPFKMEGLAGLREEVRNTDPVFSRARRAERLDQTDASFEQARQSIMDAMARRGASQPGVPADFEIARAAARAQAVRQQLLQDEIRRQQILSVLSGQPAAQLPIGGFAQLAAMAPQAAGQAQAVLGSGLFGMGRNMQQQANETTGAILGLMGGGFGVGAGGA